VELLYAEPTEMLESMNNHMEMSTNLWGC